MKKYFFTLFFMSLSVFLQAQIDCPTAIKISGKSTPLTPILTVIQGQNSCNEAWPKTITINGSLIYNFVDCSGSNLVYEIQAGQTVPSNFEMSIDFGNGVECQYNANGNLITLLSGHSVDSNGIGVVVSSNILHVQINASNIVKSLNLFSIYGKRVCHELNSTTLDISNISTGVYILKIETQNGVFSKKIMKH